MEDGGSVHVHGTASRKLLQSLSEWQAAWAKWRPGVYQIVTITVDEVSDASTTSRRALAAFSGGVDAAFTVRRHTTGAAGWQTLDLSAALLVHGYDIPISQPDVFRRARERARQMLEGQGLDLLTVSTNLRDLGQNWEDVCGLAIASALALHTPDYGVGLIGSSEAYDAMVIPWGSNPVTDHLCSTGLIEIRHDGAGFNRSEKAASLVDWPEALNLLRVCWAGDMLDRNCGICEKCARTRENFRIAGMENPPCFSETQKRTMVKLRSAAEFAEWHSIAREATKATRPDIANYARRIIRRSRPEAWLRQQVWAHAALRTARRKARVLHQYFSPRENEPIA